MNIIFCSNNYLNSTTSFKLVFIFSIIYNNFLFKICRYFEKHQAHPYQVSKYFGQIAPFNFQKNTQLFLFHFPSLFILFLSKEWSVEFDFYYTTRTYLYWQNFIFILNNISCQCRHSCTCDFLYILSIFNIITLNFLFTILFLRNLQ